MRYVLIHYSNELVTDAWKRNVSVTPAFCAVVKKQVKGLYCLLPIASFVHG